MTLFDVKSALGISSVHEVSKGNTVFELPSGHAHPATTLEIRMWELIQQLVK
jgi:hypothetical protein